MLKKFFRALMVLVILAALAAAGWFGYRYFTDHYVRIRGEYLRRDTEVMDLSGQTIEDFREFAQLTRLKVLDLRGTGVSISDYEWLHASLPDCEILWELPFQGKYLPLDTRSIRLTALTDDEIFQLDYLPQLVHVDAMDCADYDQLMALQAHRPDCTVLYRVVFGGGDYLGDAEQLRLADVTVADLEQWMPMLPGVKQIYLTGQLPERSELDDFCRQYPEVELNWEVAMGEQNLDRSAEELDFSVCPTGLAGVEDVMTYFDAPRWVNLRGCDLVDEEVRSLIDRYPDRFFYWDMAFADTKLSTDAEEADISGMRISDPAEIEDLLPYFPYLRKVVMCNCGLSNQQMDELNRGNPDVRFIWNVQLGKKMFRTDATYYMPIKWEEEVNDGDVRNLRYCEDMVSVDLGHMEITNCDWAAYMPHLKFLVLADTEVSDISPLADHKELVFLELFITKVKDLSPLESCTALEDLNLCYLYADPTPISRMTWLKRVWWSRNWTASDMLPKTLTETQLEFHPGSSTGAGWRTGKRYYEMRDFMGVVYLKG